MYKFLIVFMLVVFTGFHANAQLSGDVLTEHKLNECTNSIKELNSNHKIFSKSQQEIKTRLVAVEIDVAHIKESTEDIKETVNNINREKNGTPSIRELLIYLILSIFGVSGFGYGRLQKSRNGNK